uniref:Uncharacterized protein n=1 Tax=Rhizophora mucronata TaxID=61149 RepID=A0A2P2JHY0_RHIMU
MLKTGLVFLNFYCCLLHKSYFLTVGCNLPITRLAFESK